MKFIPILLFSVSANIDNFVVGVAYGIKKVKINVWCNIVIAGVTFIGTFLSMVLGKFLFSFMNQRIANIIGSTILILLGLVYTIKSLKDSKENKKQNENADASRQMLKDEKISDGNKELKYKDAVDEAAHDIKFYEELIDNPEEAVTELPVYIDLKEAFYIGVALTLNNIAIGVTASVAGMNILLTAIMSFIVSLMAIVLGYILGKTYLSKILGKYGSLISGVIIILLGVYELFI